MPDNPITPTEWTVEDIRDLLAEAISDSMVAATALRKSVTDPAAIAKARGEA